MSHRSLRQIKNINLNFCDWGGSSNGFRTMLKLDEFYNILNNNSDVKFNFTIKRNKHPSISVNFINGRYKTFGLNNLGANEIIERINETLNESGRQSLKHNGYKVIGTNKSIQGRFDPYIFSFKQEHGMQHFIGLEQDDLSEEKFAKLGFISKNRRVAPNHATKIKLNKSLARDFVDY